VATGDFVQQLVTAGGGAATSVTGTLSVASSSGNSIVVFTTQATAGSTPSSCADTKGNTYVLIGSLTGRDPSQAVWMASNPTPLASGDTITATWSSASAGVSLDALEFVGRFDTASAVAVSNNSAASSTTFDSGSGTVPAGDCLLLGTVGRPAVTAFTASPSGDGTWTVAAAPTNATSFGRAYRPAYQFRASGGGTLRYTGSVGGTAFASNTLAIAVPAQATAFSGTLARTGSGTTSFGAAAMTASGPLARTGSGTLTLTPTLIGGQGGALTVTGSGTTTFGGVPRPAGSLTRTGSGTLTLAGAPATSGTLAVTGSGNLQLAGLGFGTLTVTGSGTLTLAPATFSTMGSLAVTGSGLLTLGAAALATGGALARTGSGQLVLTGTAALVGVLVVTGSGLLTMTGFGYILVPWAAWSGTEWMEIHPKVWDGTTWLDDIPVRALT
jgi:fibronectin-binding autotransporter adhesin